LASRGATPMARIDAFFKLMAEQKASDLHLSTNNSPMLRINGDLVRVDFPPLKNDDLKAMVYEIAPEGKIKQFEETLDVDFGYEVPDVMRYRVNFFQQKYGISAAFRSIPSQVLTVEELGLTSVRKKFSMLKKGLFLVTSFSALCTPPMPPKRSIVSSTSSRPPSKTKSAPPWPSRSRASSRRIFSNASTNLDASRPLRSWSSTPPSPISCAREKRTKS